jgi:hypothetical protein
LTRPLRSGGPDLRSRNSIATGSPMWSTLRRNAPVTLLSTARTVYSMTTNTVPDVLRTTLISAGLPTDTGRDPLVGSWHLRSRRSCSRAVRPSPGMLSRCAVRPRRRNPLVPVPGLEWGTDSLHLAARDPGHPSTEGSGTNPATVTYPHRPGQGRWMSGLPPFGLDYSGHPKRLPALALPMEVGNIAGLHLLSLRPPAGPRPK